MDRGALKRRRPENSAGQFVVMPLQDGTGLQCVLFMTIRHLLTKFLLLTIVMGAIANPAAAREDHPVEITLIVSCVGLLGGLESGLSADQLALLKSGRGVLRIHNREELKKQTLSYFQNLRSTAYANVQDTISFYRIIERNLADPIFGYLALSPTRDEVLALGRVMVEVPLVTVRASPTLFKSYQNSLEMILEFMAQHSVTIEDAIVLRGFPVPAKAEFEQQRTTAAYKVERERQQRARAVDGYISELREISWSTVPTQNARHFLERAKPLFLEKILPQSPTPQQLVDFIELIGKFNLESIHNQSPQMDLYRDITRALFAYAERLAQYNSANGDYSPLRKLWVFSRAEYLGPYNRLLQFIATP